MPRANKNKQNTPTRQDWENNHWLIYDAYLQEFKQTQKPPTQTRLAELTGLNRQTIANHLRDTTLPDLIPSVKMRTMRVLHGLAKRAEQGFASEVKLWMQIVEGWRETMGIEHSGEIGITEARQKLQERLNQIKKGKDKVSNN